MSQKHFLFQDFRVSVIGMSLRDGSFIIPATFLFADSSPAIPFSYSRAIPTSFQRHSRDSRIPPLRQPCYSEKHFRFEEAHAALRLLLLCYFKGIPVIQRSPRDGDSVISRKHFPIQDSCVSAIRMSLRDGNFVIPKGLPDLRIPPTGSPFSIPVLFLHYSRGIRAV